MAYAHAQTDPRAKLGSLLFVGGLHAAVGMGLIAALGVTAIIDDEDEVITAINVPADPPVQPIEPVETPEPVVKQTTITAPDPIIPLTQSSEIEVIFPEFTGPTEVSPLAGPEAGPIALPPAPKPTFTPTRPVPRNNPQDWITTNDYPRRDLYRENEGIAQYSLTINERGRVEQCTVTGSSGHRGLDEATCRHLERRARFDPALNGEQKPVAGTFTGRVNWQIPE